MFRKKQSEKLQATLSGSVITYALVIMAAVSILLVSTVGFIVSQIRNASHEEASERAFQIAESGIHFYKWYLAHETDGRNAQQIQAFWSSGSAYGVGTPYETEYLDPDGDPVGRFRVTVTPPDPGSTIAWAEAEGWTYQYPDLRRTVRVRFRRPSWSESAVLANDFMRFGEGTEVYGKIHSNGGIRFDGLAHNIVTSASTEVNDPDHTGGNEFGVHTHVNAPPGSGVNDSFRPDEAPPNSVPSRTDVFEAGREFPVASVDFSGVLGDLSLMKSEAQSGNGVYFNDSGRGRRIILQPDGTFDVCRVRNVDSGNMSYRYYRTSGWGSCWSCSGNCLATYDIPDDGIIFVEDNVWLSGQIDGERVTVVAAKLSGWGTNPSVYIPNDLLYTTYDGSDVIGVIGQENVSIPEGSENDLRIDAALLAQEGRVGRSNYGTSDHKDVITVFGAIATNERYGFAWTNGYYDWGYDVRNLLYDNNLLYVPPPYFPTGTQYIVDLWEEL
jgi:hypothetical protein